MPNNELLARQSFDGFPDGRAANVEPRHQLDLVERSPVIEPPSHNRPAKHPIGMLGLGGKILLRHHAYHYYVHHPVYIKYQNARRSQAFRGSSCLIRKPNMASCRTTKFFA